MNCKYKHCLHPGIPVEKEEAIKVGSTYYHPDCYELKNTVAEIIDYFSKEINPDVVYMLLVRTINNICFPKNKAGVPAERLLFQLKYYKNHGGRIQYPGGLYYVLQDRGSFEAWREYKAKKKLKDVNFTVSDEQNSSKEGSVKINKIKSFEDIIKERS